MVDKLMRVAKKMYKPGGSPSKNGMHRPEGAGNFDNMDDYNIVDSINTNTGTIQHTPVNEKDIANKKYVDDNSGGTWTDTSTNTGTNKTLDDFSNLIEADQVHIQVRNESGSAMSRGDLVFISGYNLGLDRPLVTLTDANGVGTFPAIGILDAAANNNQDTHCTVQGRFTDIDTSAFSVGDSVYMSETAGEFSTRPTAAASQVQAIGIVLRSNLNNGVLEITGAGRTNDIPNEGHDDFTDFVANEHIDWKNTTEDLETTGKVKGKFFEGIIGTQNTSTDDFDVSGIGMLEVGTGGGDVVFGGLSGGITGQVLFIAKVQSANNLTIEFNEAAGDQKFLTTTGFDRVLTTRGGFMFYCRANGFWQEINFN